MSTPAWISFEGRMVSPEAAEAAERARRGESVDFGPATRNGRPLSGEARAQAILDASHEDYLQAERKRQADARAEAERTAREAALYIELPLRPVGEHPEVRFIQQRIAEAATAGTRLSAARAAHERARAASEAATRRAVEAELQAGLGKLAAGEAERARTAAVEAAQALERAAAEVQAAERAADDQARETDILKEHLAAAEARAQAELQAAGLAHLHTEIEATQASIAAAVEANERLYRTAVALQKMGVQLVDSPHLPGFVRPELWGTQTAYGNWLTWLSQHMPAQAPSSTSSR